MMPTLYLRQLVRPLINQQRFSQAGTRKLCAARRIFLCCTVHARKTLHTSVSGVVSQSLPSGIFKQLAPRLRPLLPCLRRSATDTASRTSAELSPRAEKLVGRWLLACAGMCFGAVVIGGITRLTESGLSMTQWHLIKGMKPPRTDEEWQAEFERYKQFPEYKYLERELTLEAFKNIFFWEYLHRMWGRTIGLVFIFPAMYFLKKGYITKAMKPRLAIYGSFLLFQGLLGWYMVKSGLQEKPDSMDIPRVSQYRLAAHLGSAFVLYALFLHQGLNHVFPAAQMPRTAQLARLSFLSHGAMGLIFFTALSGNRIVGQPSTPLSGENPAKPSSSGAFVAGLDAGLTYNTWPKMADRWIPDDILAKSPKWKNFLENPTTTQFQHRHLGEFTAVAMLGLWWLCRKTPIPPRAKMAANALGIMAIVQMGLGVATILNYVPVHLAAAHQAGALTMLSFALWLNNELRRVVK